MKPLFFLRDARRKQGSRTHSAVLNYSLGRRSALVAGFVHLPEGKKTYFWFKSFDWLWPYLNLAIKDCTLVEYICL